MRLMCLAFIVVVLVYGCTEETRSTRATIDSTVNTLDTAVQQIGNKAEKIWDSTKSRAKDLQESLDRVFDKKKDTTKIVNKTNP